MNVAELIETLESMTPEAEVKLAIQPQWPFQHSIGEVVEAEVTQVQWAVRYADENGKEEIEFGQDENSRESAQALLYKLRAMGLEGTVVGKPDTHIEFSDEDTVSAWLEEHRQDAVYISDGGQDCYLPPNAKQILGW